MKTLASLVCLLVLVPAALAADAGTATFTTDDSGSFPKTFTVDKDALTVDLSGLPKDARIFRAELYIPGLQQFQNRPMKPTTVYLDGQPDKKLKWVAPRFVSLDCLEAVQAAVKAGAPLKLKCEVVLNRPSHLEVSYVGGKPSASPPACANVRVLHRSGQSLIVFDEPKLSAAAAVPAPYDAFVEKVNVKPGQAVQAGDVLAVLKTDEMKLQLASAKAERDAAAKEQETAQAEKKDKEAAAAKAKLDKANAQIKQLEGRIAAAELKAPAAGTIADFDPAKLTGVAVKAGAALLTVECEAAPGAYPETKTGTDTRRLQDALRAKNPRLAFRIWRSSQKITPDTIDKASLVGECGLMTCWNAGYHQDGTGAAPPLRYHVADGQPEVPWGTGVYANNPDKPGQAFYAVTAAIAGQEDFSKLAASAEGVAEVVGQGEPILQWIEEMKGVQSRQGSVTRLVFTRWEAFPHSSTPSKPIDYQIIQGNDPMPEPGKMPRETQYRAYKVEPAPVGLHLHCWGGSLNGGYGWWHNAHRGAILVASNQIPYDWWTGYHDANGTSRTFGDGFVRPFSIDRTFGFLDWADKQWADAPEPTRKHARKLDLTRVFTAGSSMGGSGAPMNLIRRGPQVAWCIAWVGVHIPAETPQFAGSYQGSYGPRNEAITMPDGKTSPWDYFSDVWWLRENPKAEIGFIMASNGKNDGAIGWPQALKFARALQETRRPHMYNWEMGGHGTRTIIGANFELDVRTDQTLPAFTNCTLDSNIGTAAKKTDEQLAAEKAKQEEEVKEGKRKAVSVDPIDGDSAGQLNAYLWWKTADVIDTPTAWEMTVILQDRAPKDECKVDLTPRRVQQFKTPKGAKCAYTVTAVKDGRELAKGEATADDLDLLTLKQIPLVKGENRVKIAPAK